MNHNSLEATELLNAFGLEAGQHVLFVHAHPDDESVGTGQTINQLQANGVIVHVLIATDGTASTLGNSVLVQGGGRRLEAIDALRELGIPLAQQHFLGEQDGKLATASYEQTVTGIGTLLAEYHCVALFTPGSEGFDGHSDHKAVHNAAVQAAQEFPEPVAVWGLTRIGDKKDIHLAVDPAIKLNAARHHATQYPELAQKPPLAPGKKLQNTERLKTLQAPDKILWSYFDLLFLSEYWRRVRYTKARRPDETL